MLITMLFRWLSDVFPVGNWCGKDKYERFSYVFLGVLRIKLYFCTIKDNYYEAAASI